MELESPVFADTDWKKAKRLANKFTWVDNDSFRVILDEGIEIEYDIVDLNKEHAQVEYRKNFLGDKQQINLGIFEDFLA